MSGRIPQTVLDEVLRRVDIAEVVGDYVSLAKAGRNFKGLCPFHQEKTPSFIVSPDRQTFHCFGCGAGGDAIKFVMEFEKTSFVEAVEALARRAGVRLPERSSGSPEDRRENDRIYEALRMASAFYARCLWEGRPGVRARAYLAERGLSEETAKKFGLGYAPASWDALILEGKRRGVFVEVLALAGLARAREDKPGHYDYFRDRLMFPIVGTSGRIIGFGGRCLDDSEPKYLNSPETPVFRKGATLYGLPETKNEIRTNRSAVVVEGYMDFLALYEAGFRNLVAPLGTAFTSEHARLLARYAPQAVLAYDGDGAGRRAIWGAAPLLWEAGLHARVARVPDGEDPDSCVRKQGREAWSAIVDRAVDFTEYAFDGADTSEEREEVLRRLVPALLGVRDTVRRTTLVRGVAERFGTQEERILQLMEGAARSRTGGDARGRDAMAPRGGAGAARGTAGAVGTAAATTGAGAGAARRVTPEDVAERGILRLLLKYKELQRDLGSALECVNFEPGPRRTIAERLADWMNRGVTVEVDEFARQFAVPGVAAAAAQAATGGSNEGSGGNTNDAAPSREELARTLDTILIDLETDAWEEGDDEKEARRARARAVSDFARVLRTRVRRRSLAEVTDRMAQAQAAKDMNEALATLRTAKDIDADLIRDRNAGRNDVGGEAKGPDGIHIPG